MKSFYFHTSRRGISRCVVTLIVSPPIVGEGESRDGIRPRCWNRRVRIGVLTEIGCFTLVSSPDQHLTGNIRGQWNRDFGRYGRLSDFFSPFECSRVRGREIRVRSEVCARRLFGFGNRSTDGGMWTYSRFIAQRRRRGFCPAPLGTAEKAQERAVSSILML